MTKTIMLMRHGQYDYNTFSLDDAGKAQADSVARQLTHDGLIPDVIIHSPVKRAVETAQRVRDIFNNATGKDIPMIETSWLADHFRTSVNDLTRIDNRNNLVLAVSHMPNIESLYANLTRRHDSASNCQTFVIDSQVSRWNEMRSGKTLKVFRP